MDKFHYGYFTVHSATLSDAVMAMRKAVRVIEARDRFLGDSPDDTASRLHESWRVLDEILNSWVPPEKPVDPTDSVE